MVHCCLGMLDNLGWGVINTIILINTEITIDYCIYWHLKNSEYLQV